MKLPASLARLEVALIETQYALSDLWQESEANAGTYDNLTAEIADRAIKTSMCVSHLLEIVSDEYSRKRCKIITVTTTAPQDQSHGSIRVYRCRLPGPMF